MDLVLFLLTLAVVAVIVVIALGHLPGGMPEPASTVPVVRLPTGPVTGDHVHGLRFPAGLRGYRMDQVDDALDQLAREVDQLRALVPPEVLRAHDHAEPPNAGQPQPRQPDFYQPEPQQPDLHQPQPDLHQPRPEHLPHQQPSQQPFQQSGADPGAPRPWGGEQ